MVLDSYDYALCNASVEETAKHLFFKCPFSECCWDLLHIQIPSQTSILETLEILKDGLHTHRFMSIIILLCCLLVNLDNQK